MKLISALLVLLFATVNLAAWITHCWVCIKSAAWILLLFGCFFFPVGVIHGWGVWLGIF